MAESRHVAAMRRDLGRQLAQLRFAAWLTQAGLAAEAGYSRATVSLAETGHDVGRLFWPACDKVLCAGGMLADAAERIAAVRGAERWRALDCPHCGGSLTALTTLVPGDVPPPEPRPALGGS